MAVETRKRPSGISLGIYRPNRANPLKNSEIESWQVITPGGNVLTAEDIAKKTGVLLRYVATAYETPLRMGLEAGQQALNGKNDADVVIVSSSYPTGVNLAEEVVKELGLRTKSFIEIGAACSGFARGLAHLYENHEQFNGKKVLFIATEKYHPKLVNLKDVDAAKQDPSLAQTIFSDGAAAMVFEYGTGLEVLYAQNNPLNYEEYEGAIRMPIDRGLIRQPYIEEEVATSESGYFMQKGRTVIDAVRMHIPGLIAEVAEEAGLAVGATRIIPHQGSRIILQVLARSLARSISEPNLSTRTEEGNWSSASIMKALMEDIEDGEVCGNDNVIFASFGAGKGLFASTVIARLAA